MTSGRIRLLLDEHIWEALADALRERGYECEHVSRINLRQTDDDVILAIATEQQRAVLTNNFKDFVPLVQQWALDERDHAGVILTTLLPKGELLRQTLALLSRLNAQEIRNTVRWLQEFS